MCLCVCLCMYGNVGVLAESKLRKCVLFPTKSFIEIGNHLFLIKSHEKNPTGKGKTLLIVRSE